MIRVHITAWFWECESDAHLMRKQYQPRTFFFRSCSFSQTHAALRTRSIPGIEADQMFRIARRNQTTLVILARVRKAALTGKSQLCRQ